MDLRWNDTAETYVLMVSGKLDSNSAPELSGSIEAHIGQGPKDLVIDFSSVDFISSAGLRVIIKASHLLGAGKKKVIQCGLKDYVREVFDLAGLSRLLDIRDTLAAALTPSS